MNKSILLLYMELLSKYGPQGWWPLLELHTSESGVNPTKTGSVNGYHPKDYSYPKTDSQKFEICIGAILTQNTSWPNVEKSLIALNSKKLLDARKLVEISEEVLGQLIRPAGYYNQKSKKLKIFAKFYLSLKGRIPSRDELLALWGIGPETADSILLYAYKQPEFVVDTYTKRLLKSRNIINDAFKYDYIKKLFESNLKKDYALYQEYHALIVENGKK